MNPTALVLRWYRGTAGGATPQPEQYTAEEVLQLLHPDHHTAQANAERPDHQPVNEHPGLAPETFAAASARGAAVRAVASRPSAWLGRLSKQHRREIGALADRLPTLVFHHSVGGRPADLLRRYGGWSVWRYERALELAAGCIAGELNRSRLAA